MKLVNTPLLRRQDNDDDDPVSIVSHGGTLSLALQLPIERRPIIHSFPLHIAVAKKREDLVKVLLENGANPNVPNINHETPLHLAIGAKDIASLNLLLEYGADPNAKMSHDDISRSANVDPQVLQQSLEENNASCEIPLNLAIKNKIKKAVQLLLNFGASPIALGRNGLAPLDIAVQEDDVWAAEMLISRGAQNVESYDSDKLLEIAAEHGSLNIGNFFLNTLKEKPAKNRLVRAMLKSIAHGHVAFLDLLLEHGNSKRLANSDFEILLRAAFETRYHFNGLDDYYGPSRQGKLAAEHIVAYSSNKASLLAYAVNSHNKYLLEIVLASNINPNMVLIESQNVLSYAVQNNLHEICTLLLEYNANPTVIDNHGMSPWAYLFSRGCSMSLAEEFLTRIPLDTRCHGKTPLHWAAEFGRVDIARWLIAAGVDQRLVDGENNTPLSLAIKHRKVGVAMLLLESHIKSHPLIYSCGGVVAIAALCYMYKHLKPHHNRKNINRPDRKSSTFFIC